MRTLGILTVGIWIGRQMYLKHDKATLKRKEKAIKVRLETYLKTSGMSTSKVKKTVKSIINT